MKKFPRFQTAWFASGALVLLSMSAGAQTPQSDSAVPPSAQDVPEATAPALAVEDKKIDQFADAYIAVQEIQTKASEQLSATADADKADAVKQDAESQMIKAVEKSGLQIAEFNQIVQAIASDATLRERVSDKIGERKQTS